MTHAPGLTACRDCLYWSEQPELAKLPQGPTRIGNCQRFPPQLVMLTQISAQGQPVQQPLSLFPVTVALGSCGEFQGRSLIES